MLVSRLALVDALMGPTTELRAQHKYKTLVVQTADLDDVSLSAPAEHSPGGRQAGGGHEAGDGSPDRHQHIPAGKGSVCKSFISMKNGQGSATIIRM